jgi:hypothetical protein
MADFTITTTLTGNVNGRAIAVEHTYTLEDITHVVEDSGVVAPGAALRTLQTDAQGRGYHVENAPKFVAFAFQQAMSGKVLCTTSGASSCEILLAGNVPMAIHHGENFDGNMDSDPGGTPPDPSEDLEALTFLGVAPYEFRTIALFKPVS